MLDGAWIWVCSFVDDGKVRKESVLQAIVRSSAVLEKAHPNRKVPRGGYSDELKYKNLYGHVIIILSKNLHVLMFSSLCLKHRQPTSLSVASSSTSSSSTSSESPDWSPDSWNQKTVAQPPNYEDEKELQEALDMLKGFSPLVFAGEVRTLHEQLARACSGQGFVLMGGDCAEAFNEFNVDHVRDRSEERV